MIEPGDVVVVKAIDDVPEHEVLVQEVFEGCVTGVALTGPLAGEYREPDREMIVRVLGQQGTQQPQQTTESNKKIGTFALTGRQCLQLAI